MPAVEERIPQAPASLSSALQSIVGAIQEVLVLELRRRRETLVPWSSFFGLALLWPLGKSRRRLSSLAHAKWALAKRTRPPPFFDYAGKMLARQADADQPRPCLCLSDQGRRRLNIRFRTGTPID